MMANASEIKSQSDFTPGLCLYRGGIVVSQVMSDHPRSCNIMQCSPRPRKISCEASNSGFDGKIAGKKWLDTVLPCTSMYFQEEKRNGEDIGSSHLTIEKPCISLQRNSSQFPSSQYLVVMSDCSRGTVWKFEAHCSAPNRMSRSQNHSLKKEWNRFLMIRLVYGKSVSTISITTSQNVLQVGIPHRPSGIPKKRRFVFALAFATAPKSTK